MKDELYEQSYTDPNHFSFGKNWQDFLINLNEEQIKKAEDSLIDFLGGKKNIVGKTFVDVGCGSGLFSLAAWRIGAKRVLSIDIDQFSIACVTHLREQAKKPANWQITSGSALDERFITSLGTFDIVYSWGVLHHTGDMYTAIKNAGKLVKHGGVFYLAIYNHNRSNMMHGTSGLWLTIKKRYNQSGWLVKTVLERVYSAYLCLGLLAHLRNPWRYINGYSSARGMSWHHDVIDWLGGYPYQFATPEQIINYLGQIGFACQKLVSRSGIGCNEYLMRYKI